MTVPNITQPQIGQPKAPTAGTDASPKVKMPPGFKFKPDGLWFENDRESGPIRICGPIRVEAKTSDDRGNNWGLLLSWLDDDGLEHRWAMPRSMLSGDTGELRAVLLDQGLYVSPSRKARDRLCDFLASVDVDARTCAVDRVGWQDGAFALPDRTIGDSCSRRIIYQGPARFDHPYLEAGTLDDWSTGIACHGVGNILLAVAISSAFVGPLLGLLDEEGGGLHFRGPSSIGKSTALIAAASVWGEPRRFVRQWRATTNGLEGVAVQHSETLLCLDELGQLDPREAGIVAYLLANGTGKARAGRSGAARASATWRTLFLSSGEIGLAELAARDGRGIARPGAGQEVRILDIDADAGAGLGLFHVVNAAEGAEALARKIKDGAASSFGIAGPAFVKALIAKGLDPCCNFARKGIKDFVSKHLPKDAGGQAHRAARRFALIAMAGELAQKLGVLPWSAGEAERAAALVMARWLSERGGAGALEDRAAIAQVRAFIETHGASRFEMIGKNADESERLGDGRPVNNRAGFCKIIANTETREHYILREAWKEVCVGIDAKRTAHVLAEHKMLRRDRDGGTTCPVNLPTIGKTRVYVILSTLLTDGCG